MDSFFDPSEVGYWEPTPINLPILKRLDIIDEPDTDPPNLTQVMPQDLIVERKEYVIGESDTITISILDLDAVGVETPMTQPVNNLGIFRHPRLGPIRVAGFTPSELEEEVSRIIVEQGLLKDPSVSVNVNVPRQRTFSVIGAFGGTFSLLKSDLRLFEATALIGRIPSSIKRLFIIRRTDVAQPQPPTDVVKVHELARNPAEEIIELLENADDEDRPDEADGEPATQSVPDVLAPGLESPSDAHWANVDGQWVWGESPSLKEGAVRADQSRLTPLDSNGQVSQVVPQTAQRVIEIPYDLLRKGDLRYDVVIRPGDIIRIPQPELGRIYIGGFINRPGTYTVPGESSLTLKQIVFAAGGFNGEAMPDRVDLIRRIGTDHEATIRLNARAIFEGNEPDFFIKPDDTINIGTNLPAYPLSVVRRSFRMTYGFGFILDRNFANVVYRR